MSNTPASSRHDSGLIDMADMPMSPAWHHLLAHHRDTIRDLMRQHADAAGKVCNRTTADAELDEVAQRLGTAAIENIDRLTRTMEAAGVLAPKRHG